MLEGDGGGAPGPGAGGLRGPGPGPSVQGELQGGGSAPGAGVRAVRRVETPPRIQAQHNWFTTRTRVGGQPQEVQALVGVLSHSRGKFCWVSADSVRGRRRPGTRRRTHIDLPVRVSCRGDARNWRRSAVAGPPSDSAWPPARWCAGDAAVDPQSLKPPRIGHGTPAWARTKTRWRALVIATRANRLVSLNGFLSCLVTSGDLYLSR